MIYPDYGILQADRTGILPEQKYRLRIMQNIFRAFAPLM